MTTLCTLTLVFALRIGVSIQTKVKICIKLLFIDFITIKSELAYAGIVYGRIFYRSLLYQNVQYFFTLYRFYYFIQSLSEYSVPFVSTFLSCVFLNIVKQDFFFQNISIYLRQFKTLVIADINILNRYKTFNIFNVFQTSLYDLLIEITIFIQYSKTHNENFRKKCFTMNTTFFNNCLVIIVLLLLFTVINYRCIYRLNQSCEKKTSIWQVFALSITQKIQISLKSNQPIP